jgi:hypothetical protein
MVSSSSSTTSDRIKQAGTIGVPIYTIAYDFEHWTQTPLSEQVNPLGSMNTATATFNRTRLK